MELLIGTPHPLGLSIEGNKANFALYSSTAKKVILGLFSLDQSLKEIEMNRTENVWHISISGLEKGLEYAFRCDEAPSWLADPYAKIMGNGVRAQVKAIEPFDWQQVYSPQIPIRDLVIYEMHVRGFTQDPSSRVAQPGTYLGVIEKIPYLKKLGINAIELMPIFEFDQNHCKKNMSSGKPRVNYWGYNPLHFFFPTRWYAYQDSIHEFKTLVRELHKNGIEVILDVVFNHTGEGKDRNYVVNFRGIDDQTYYMLDEKGNYLDFSGCDNTFNTNHPVVQELILDSLRYWIQEMHVDGFRFDLASILTRGLNGDPIESPPLIEKISQDPLISKVKLIAEAWDAAGLYQLGQFHRWGNWSEWNGRYRDYVRRFIKGLGSNAGSFANVLCGTDELYPNPSCSVNFITSHDGFTLRDLVTYQTKHNIDNGELNRDGSEMNDSWNCGIEGPTDQPAISSLRERQMRNFFLTLFISQGIPMILMNDVYGHTQNGNNNAYVQDNRISWFLWDQRKPKMEQFIASLIDLRKQFPQLRMDHTPTQKEIDWHGTSPFKPDWNSQFIAMTIKGEVDLYIAFNASDQPADVELPDAKWRQIIHTEQDWIFEKKGPILSSIKLPPYSAILAQKENSLL